MMNLDSYLDRDIWVTPVDDYDSGYNWLDYRVGCDLCCNGNAFGIETNLEELMDKDSFLLNDIRIKPHRFYSNFYLKTLYVFSDFAANEEIFEELRSIYAKIGMKCTKYLQYNHDSNK